ncbi:hypothetical protein H257_12052 [Aphanomyces astaci]|uniref:Uncharacterized protein n=1 Tax=Aphanomyces astaci TaxID=112090 RepID=W4FZV5_APHAT|nr:hypothetical protein H257_12052 [Aphanomyces astaci]ETV73007.1 hypothetical protein H257_12052 [Aphanomyces astaci]|eukprot:XP_009837456.1 hypothetical protein H257_12052 [Aphanomyces astaci]
MEAYPVELKEVPRPLVAALGPKDLQARVLPVLRSINEEFVPQLQIKSLSFDHRFVFPIKKDKSTSLSPPPSKGIWKTDWLKKHHEVLPSVVLLLYAFEPRLATRDWAIQETVIRDEVEDLRRMLSGRDVKILLVLVQLLDDAATTTASPSTSSSMVNVPSSDDRLQSLRKRAELDAKSVWLLKDIVSRTHPTLIKLEAAIRMNAIEYYKAQAKRVKKAKNPSKLMAARHSFKVAHYYEFRQHMSKMVLHYEAAYKSLLHMAESSSSVEVQTQVRAVAEFVHFKLVYHALLTNRQLKTAVDQLHRHMASPVSQISPNHDICMHWGYMSRQYHVFGQLMVEAQRRGGLPPPTAAANPIDSDLYNEVYLYFSVAAKYATRRRLAAAKAGLSYDPNHHQPPVATPPAADISRSMYLGMANQRVAETSIPHAALAIHLLTQALHHVTDDVAHHRHRLKHRLGLRLALEHLANREYSVARQRLQLACTVYIQERWYGLVSEILGHLVTCARQERDTAAFLDLSMQLLSPKLEPYVSARVRDTVHANLFVAFDHVTSSQMTSLPELSLDDGRLTASLISVAIHCTNSALVATFESSLPVDVAFYTLGFVFTQDGGAPCVVELQHETTADLLLSPHTPRTFQVPVTPFSGNGVVACQQVRFGLRNRHHVPWTWTLAGPFAAQPRHRLVRRNSFLLPEINGRVPGMGQGAGSPSFQRANLRHGADTYPDSLFHQVDKATVDLISTSPVLVDGVTCLEFVLHAPSTDHVHHPRCAVTIDDQSCATVLGPVSQDQLISPQLAQSDQRFQVVVTCHSPGPVLVSVHVAYETTRGEYVQIDIPFTVHAVLPVTLSTAKTDGVATVNGSGFMLVAHVKAAVAPLRVHKLALTHVTPYATIVQSGNDDECATLGAGDAHSLVLHVTPREVTVSHILAHVLVHWSSLDHPEHVVTTELALPSMAFQPAPLSVKIDDMPVFGTQGHVTWVHVRLTNHTISGYIVDVQIASDSSEFLVAGVVDGHNVQVLPMETISVTIGLVPLHPGHLTLPKVKVVHVDSNETFRATDQRVTLFVVPDNHTTSAAMLLA